MLAFQILERNYPCQEWILIWLCFEYLHRNRHVILPMTISKESFMADLTYDRIDIVETCKILHNFSSVTQSQISIRIGNREGILAEIDSWDIYIATVVLVKACFHAFPIQQNAQDFCPSRPVAGCVLRGPLACLVFTSLRQR